MPRYTLARVQVTVAELGTVRLAWTTDYATGATVYRVTAPRVAGSFTVLADQRSYESTMDVDTPLVRVVYGRGALDYVYGDRHEDRPVVNGVRLVGGTVVDTTKLRAHLADGAWAPGRRLDGRDVAAFRSTGLYTSRPAPPATERRTAVIIEALLCHWLTRPDNLALRLAAAHHRAQRATRELCRAIEKRREDIAAAQADIAAARDQAAELSALLAVPLPAGK